MYVGKHIIITISSYARIVSKDTIIRTVAICSVRVEKSG